MLRQQVYLDKGALKVGDFKQRNGMVITGTFNSFKATICSGY
jgi:hypothetical protein